MAIKWQSHGPNPGSLPAEALLGSVLFHSAAGHRRRPSTGFYVELDFSFNSRLRLVAAVSDSAFLMSAGRQSGRHSGVDYNLQ